MSHAITRNFSHQELACPCCQRCSMDPVFLTRLQAYRDHLATPLTLTSGFRCIAHNEKVNGKVKSQHLLGLAVDISLAGLNGAERFRLLKAAFALGFTGIGVGSDLLHLDLRRGEAKNWTY